MTSPFYKSKEPIYEVRDKERNLKYILGKEEQLPVMRQIEMIDASQNIKHSDVQDALKSLTEENKEHNEKILKEGK